MNRRRGGQTEQRDGWMKRQTAKSNQRCTDRWVDWKRDEGTYRQTDRQMRSMIDAHTKVLMDR
jgi:hypothetical protein